MNKPADNVHPIHELLQKRWSPRAYSPRPVEREKLLSLFEAARWSPSAANSQPWHFIVASREEEGAYAKMRETLTERNRLWSKDVPLLVLAVAQVEREEGKQNPWALYDLGQAVAHLSVQATALGLYVHQMAGFDREKARSFFEIPAGFDPVAVAAVGYYGSVEELPQEFRDREIEARTRKPLQEFLHDGGWKASVVEPELVN